MSELTKEKRHSTTPYWDAVFEMAWERLKNGECPFTTEEKDKADDWQTCVCGNQDPRIPRCFDGTPLDLKLARLGLLFPHEVNFTIYSHQEGRADDCKRHLTNAQKTMSKIEERARQVLAEMESPTGQEEREDV